MATFASRIKAYLEQIEESIDNLDVYIGDSEFFRTYGIRFDVRKDLEVGFVFGNSKSNIDREDERDFPEYGTQEYEDMEELNGTCAYYVFSGDYSRFLGNIDRELDYLISETNEDYAWYIVGTNEDTEEGEDIHEIIMKNATVVARFNYEA